MKTARIRISGLIRYLRVDHNPLRRPVDRIHSWIVLTLMVAIVIIGPVMTAVVAHATYDAGLRTERGFEGTHHQVDATVLGTAPGSFRSGTGQTSQVQWRDTSGVLRSGVTDRRDGDRPGAHRKVWVDQAGNLSGSPLDRSETVAGTVLASVATFGTLCLLVVTAHILVDWRLDRRPPVSA